MIRGLLLLFTDAKEYVQGDSSPVLRGECFTAGGQGMQDATFKSDLSSVNVTAVGELLFDVSPEGRTPGGAPANFAFHSLMHGASGAIVTAVGQDREGSELLAFCHGRGLAVYPWISSCPTGVSQVTAAGGEISYDIRENSAWDDLHLTDEALQRIKGSDVLAYGSLAARSPAGRQALEDAVSAVSGSCLRFCDLNLRQHYYSSGLVSCLIKSSDVLKLNFAEYMTVCDLFGEKPGIGIPDTFADLESGFSRLEKVMTALAARYDLKGVLLTAGECGSAVWWDGECLVHPASPAAPGGDAVGAGDAFSAAFLCRILAGAAPDAALKHASEYAAGVCSYTGAWSDDVKRHMNDI